MDPIGLLSLPTRPFARLCSVPRHLEDVTSIAEETPARELGLATGAVEAVWGAIEDLYRSGLHPAIQVCIRRHGEIVLHRAIGHRSGNEPGSPPDAPRTLATTATPFNLFSASKAVTAMVIHRLDDEGLLHLDDRVADYIPEFAAHGKQWITVRHVLCHRAGIPTLPPHLLDSSLLEKPEEILQILCEAKPVSRAGRRLAYHAVTGGFVLGEVVRRVCGKDIRQVLHEKIQAPLGFRWMNYGVAPADLPEVAVDAFTGLPLPPPLSTLLRRALGVDAETAVRISNEPAFRTGIVPAGNLISTAEEASAFYQCLLNEGELDGTRIFGPRTVRRATSEQTYWELDLTLGVPLRYGLGFMLGGELISLFGSGTPHAFGHLGFTNIFNWADPERALAVAILSSGKPVISPGMLRLVQLLLRVHDAFPKV
ncbi:MAG TPA: serine hydrolase domain-containing protein [Myxococcota bacterium]|jgi:CubicO group peptidase (beta-lactamase class C family)|nr:serine hydrolase domain-containing protein [Myxococcota bacterium]